MDIPYTQEDVNHLFHLLGRAIWSLQHLEKAVTTFNAMKKLQRKRDKGTKITQEMAKDALARERAQTLKERIMGSVDPVVIPVGEEEGDMRDKVRRAMGIDLYKDK